MSGSVVVEGCSHAEEEAFFQAIINRAKATLEKLKGEGVIVPLNSKDNIIESASSYSFSACVNVAKKATEFSLQIFNQESGIVVKIPTGSFPEEVRTHMESSQGAGGVFASWTFKVEELDGHSLMEGGATDRYFNRIERGLKLLAS